MIVQLVRKQNIGKYLIINVAKVASSSILPYPMAGTCLQALIIIHDEVNQKKSDVVLRKKNKG